MILPTIAARIGTAHKNTTESLAFILSAAIRAHTSIIGARNAILMNIMNAF